MQVNLAYISPTTTKENRASGVGMPRRKRYERGNLRGVGAEQKLSFTFLQKTAEKRRKKRRKRDEQQTQNAPSDGAEEPRDIAQKHNAENAQHAAA